MLKFKALSGTTFALALTASCANYDLNATKNLGVGGSPFQQALYAEYLDLAVMEDDESDLPDAGYFNAKAAAAARGQSVTAQALAERKLPKNKIGELRIARNTLRQALKERAAVKAPRDAARAQAMFDCWMQEQEENDQPDDIERCRREFEKAMEKTLAALEPKPNRKTIEFIVFFGFDSSAINKAAKSTVDQIVKAAKGAGQVLLTGHTDTSGGAVYNEKLAEARAKAVEAALKSRGLTTKIVTQSLGESAPRVKTGDGVKEFGNRRVTATIR